MTCPLEEAGGWSEACLHNAPPEDQLGAFLCDMTYLEDTWRCTFMAHPLEEAGGWHQACLHNAPP